MRISYNWLKDYIDIKTSPDQTAGLFTMAGLSVESVKNSPGDSILEVEVTANRPDWLSYIGVARELAAITGRKMNIPKIRTIKALPASKESGISVKVEDQQICRRYTARSIRQVHVAESPAWLKAKIEAMGLKAVNNIVDITNLCLFETGQPMHAFDLDRIEGKVVMIRRAKKGEKIVTIDGIERTLDDSMLVIADASRPIAIAGVMGGLDTEVTSSTKNILLEAAFFDQVSIRRTSKKLGISTESSYRFERRVDAQNISYASDRAANLICELTRGQAASLTDTGKKSADKPNAIDLRYSRLNQVLGLEIAPARIKKILVSLGIEIKKSSKAGLKVEAPSFRNDLKMEIDIIEEISRIYGYEKIPVTLPNIISQASRLPSNIKAEKIMRCRLAGIGMYEIITYSLLSKKVLQSARLSEDKVIEIRNPLSSEQEVMRPSLIPGMLNAILWNKNRKAGDLKLFELGNVYLKEGPGKFIEKKHISLAVIGQAYSSWMGGCRGSSFFDLKGKVEMLFAELGVKRVSFKTARVAGFSGAACAAIEVEDEAVGVIGEADKNMLKDFDIKEPVYICEICVDYLLNHINLEKRLEELPRYPSVFRDMSIILASQTRNSDIVSCVKSTAGSILKEIKLIDSYSGKQIPEGKISLTYRLEYQDPKRTLEDKGVSDAHSKILQALAEKFGAKLR